MDHLEEAKLHLADAYTRGAYPPVREYLPTEAIAHCLLDIAETLRWFKEQKEYEINQTASWQARMEEYARPNPFIEEVIEELTKRRKEST